MADSSYSESKVKVKLEICLANSGNLYRYYCHISKLTDSNTLLLHRLN